MRSQYHFEVATALNSVQWTRRSRQQKQGKKVATSVSCRDIHCKGSKVATSSSCCDISYKGRKVATSFRGRDIHYTYQKVATSYSSRDIKYKELRSRHQEAVADELKSHPFLVIFLIYFYLKRLIYVQKYGVTNQTVI